MQVLTSVSLFLFADYGQRTVSCHFLRKSGLTDKPYRTEQRVSRVLGHFGPDHF